MPDRNYFSIVVLRLTHLLARFVKPEPEQTLLEAGCGNGYISLYPALLSGNQANLALDLNQTALEEAQVTNTISAAVPAPLAPIHLNSRISDFFCFMPV